MNSQNLPAGSNPYPPLIKVRQSPGCLLQILWFIFIGSWLGGIVITVAYVCFLLIVTFPLGIMLLNSVPTVMALRQPPQYVTTYGPVNTPQIIIIVRALWFVLVGWWLAAITLSLGYFACMTIIGLPVGFWLFDATPAVLTLRRN